MASRLKFGLKRNFWGWGEGGIGWLFFHSPARIAGTTTNKQQNVVSHVLLFAMKIKNISADI